MPDALVLDDHVQTIVVNDERDLHHAVAIVVGVPYGVATRFGHRQLQVGEQLRPDGHLTDDTAEREPREEEVVGLRREAESDGRVTHCAAPSPRSSRA